VNLPHDGKHESFYAGNAKMIVWLLCLILQDVLHDEYHILDEHRVHVSHHCLPKQKTTSTQPSTQFYWQMTENTELSFALK